MTEREWHWEQGTKYAVEAMKALLAINGGAAVALLAFAGQIGKSGGDPASIASRLGNSLFGFGFGALAATIGFIAAYFTQLYYGKGGVNDTWAHHGTVPRTRGWSSRSRPSCLGFASRVQRSSRACDIVRGGESRLGRSAPFARTRGRRRLAGQTAAARDHLKWEVIGSTTAEG